jgi:hypothetical protein
MSKKNEVLAKVEEIARRHGAGHLIEGIKQELSSVWGSETPAAAPATRTFNVTVGVEVLASAHATQADIEEGVKAALDAAASRRDEVVSLSVAGA